MEKPAYRPDIDGLRAAAVLSVVGFHAFPQRVPGGFVGVDVFFVISGFLISTIILSSLEHDRFSIVEFYRRRIRRIFPALIALLSAALAGGAFLLLPEEYASLGKHTAAGAGFVSNLVLWSESGYFDAAAEAKPLLHLWSLGIEEQFYIFWPLIMAFAWKRKPGLLSITLFLAGVSFIANIALVGPSREAAFYSPVSRFWELMMGSALAYVALHRTALLENHGEIRSVAGAVLLGAGFAAISAESAFPGWWALLPACGAFLVISAGSGAWINRKVLANRLLVGIGLISYPLYLWHWSLLSTARLAKGESLVRDEKLALIGASFLLAWLTYRYIEKPLRFGAPGRKATWLLVAMAIVGTAGFMLYRLEGIPDRGSSMSDRRKALDLVHTTGATDLAARFAPCPIPVPAGAIARPGCAQMRPGVATIALFGDSHAVDKFYGIARIAAENWLLVSAVSCPPLNGVSVIGEGPQCQERSERATRWLRDNQAVRTVVLSFFGGYILDTDYAADHVARHNGPSSMRIFKQGVEAPKPAAFFEGLEQTVRILESAGKRVVIIVDTPEMPFFPRDCLANRSRTRCSVSLASVLDRQSRLREGLSDIASRHPALEVFDPMPFLCENATCAVETADMMLYRDSHHLSARGSELFARHLLAWLDKQSAEQ